MRAGASKPRLSLTGLITPLLQKEGGNGFETFKVGLAALAVAVASFMALSGPAMAVECDHTGEPGVIECGKKNNVFLSEDRFLDNNPGFFIPVVPVFATDF